MRVRQAVANSTSAAGIEYQYWTNKLGAEERCKLRLPGVRGDSPGHRARGPQGRGRI